MLGNKSKDVLPKSTDKFEKKKARFREKGLIVGRNYLPAVELDKHVQRSTTARSLRLWVVILPTIHQEIGVVE